MIRWLRTHCTDHTGTVLNYAFSLSGLNFIILSFVQPFLSSINIIGGVVSSSKDLDDLMTCCFAQHVSHKRSSVPVYAGLYIVFGFGSPCILVCYLRSFPSFLHARLHLQVWKCPKGAFERNIQGHNSIVNCLDLGLRQPTCQLATFSVDDWIWPSCRSVAGCTIREGQQGSSQLIAGTDNGYLHFWDCAGCCADRAGCGRFDLCWPSAFRSAHSHPSSMFHRIGEVATSFRAWRQSRD